MLIPQSVFSLFIELPIRISPNGNDRSTAVALLTQDGGVAEETIESELLGTIYKCDPALDDATGRLLPGKRQSEVSLSIVLTEPDSEGTCHIGGIEGQAHSLKAALEELKVVDYEIQYRSV